MSPRHNKELRIALIHGKIPVEDRLKIVEAFNKPENNTGNYINVIVLSPSSTEGLSLFNTRYVHILEP